MRVELLLGLLLLAAVVVTARQQFAGTTDEATGGGPPSVFVTLTPISSPLCDADPVACRKVGEDWFRGGGYDYERP